MSDYKITKGAGDFGIFTMPTGDDPGIGGKMEYDDCPICQMMKKAEEEGREPTMKEMKKAFKKAKISSDLN